MGALKTHKCGPALGLRFAGSDAWVVFALAEGGGEEESPPCSGGTVLTFGRLFLPATSTLKLAQTLLKSYSKRSGWLYALVTRLLAPEEIPTFVRKNVNNCCSQKSCFIQHPGKKKIKKREEKKKNPLRPLLHGWLPLSTVLLQSRRPEGCLGTNNREKA